MVDATRTEPLLREREPLAEAFGTADDVLVRDAHVVVDDLGMATRLTGAMVGLAHRRHVAEDVDARRVGRDDEHRERLVGGRFLVARPRHHDEEVADRRVRREPLVAVDQPLVAVAGRRRLQQRRIGAGGRLRHREARAHLAVEERLHPALPLVLGATDRDQFGVAGIGRLVPEDRGRVDALPEDLVHQPELHLAEAEAAHVGREVGCPQALLADLLLERVGDPTKRLTTLRGCAIPRRASRAG